MNTNFGPWSTAIHAGSHAQLSLLLKKRFNQLETTRQAPVGISRRMFLGLTGGGIAVSVLPTLTGRAAQTESATQKEKTVPETTGNQGEPKLPGRIYVEAHIGERIGENRYKTHRDPIISLDPNTGEWTEMTPEGADAPLVSPDGKLLLYNRYGSIFGCRVDKPKEEGVLLESAIQNAWSPDGKELIITYIKNIWADQDEQRFATFRIPFGPGLKSKKEQLSIPETDLVCDWSSDGEWIVTEGKRGERDRQIFVMRLDGSDERELTNTGLKPRFAPDGKRVLFLDGRGPRSIRSIGIDGSQERTVLAADDKFGVNGAVYSPDGKWLAVFAHNWWGKPGTVAADNAVSDFRLLIVDLNGKIHKTLRPTSKGKETVFVSGGLDWA